MMLTFYDKYPKYNSLDLYVFGESYGTVHNWVYADIYLLTVLSFSWSLRARLFSSHS